MSTKIQQRMNKELFVLQYQYKNFQTIQKNIAIESTSNISNYIETINQIAKISQGIYENFLEIIPLTKLTEGHRIETQIINELLGSIKVIHRKLVSQNSDNKSSNSNPNCCEFCGDNLQENKIKKVKMSLEEDYKQKFYLVLEQMKRLSEQKIFTDKQNQFYDEVLMSQLNQRQKVLALNDKKMEEFISIMDNSFMELNKMKGTMFEEEETKEKEFKKMGRINEHISNLLKTSFEKKIPPWIHKMFSRLIHLYEEDAALRKRDIAVQANIDDPELKMARAQNRQMYRKNKQLTKELEEIKEDFKNLENIKNKNMLGYNIYSGGGQFNSGILLSQRGSNRNGESPRQSVEKKSNRSSVRSKRRQSVSKAHEANEKGQSLFMEEQILKMINKKRKPTKNVNIKISQKRKNQSELSEQTNISKNQDNPKNGFFLPQIKKNGGQTDNQVSRWDDKSGTNRSNNLIDQVREKQNVGIDSNRSKKSGKILEKAPSSNKMQSFSINNKATIKRRSQKGRESVITPKYNKTNNIKGQLSSGNSQIKNNISGNNISQRKNSQDIGKNGQKANNKMRQIIQNPIEGSMKKDGHKMPYWKDQDGEWRRNEGGHQSIEEEIQNDENEEVVNKLKAHVRKISEQFSENITKKLKKANIKRLQSHYRNQEINTLRTSEDQTVGSIKGYEFEYETHNQLEIQSDEYQSIPEQLPMDTNCQHIKIDHKPVNKLKKVINKGQQKWDDLRKSNILRNSSILSVSPEQTKAEQEQRKTLQDFGRKVYETMKKHSLIPEILNIQEFEAIIREQQLYKNKTIQDPLQKPSIIPQRKSQITQKSYESPRKIGTNSVHHQKRPNILATLSEPSKIKYDQSYYSLFLNKNQAYKYEQTLAQCYHRRKTYTVSGGQKQFSVNIYKQLSEIKSNNREKYNKICSVIRYPYQSLYNEFQIINFVTEMKYETFEYYFQKIAYIHRKCEKGHKIGVCCHLWQFFDNLCTGTL